MNAEDCPTHRALIDRAEANGVGIFYPWTCDCTPTTGCECCRCCREADRCEENGCSNMCDMDLDPCDCEDDDYVEFRGRW